MAKRSIYWQYFTKIGNIGKCKICSTSIPTSGNTTNIARHLKQNHPKEHSELENNRGETNDVNQPKIDDSIAVITSFKDGENKSNCDSKLCWMVIKDFLPFSIVESSHFRNFVSTLNSHYNLPGRKKLMSKLNEMAVNKKDLMVHHLKTIKWYCLTSDSWKDMVNQKSYLGLTIHFIDDYQPMSFCLNADEFNTSMTGAAIYEKIIVILNEWEIPKDKIVTMVTDGGANFVSAARRFDSSLHCVAHKLNLIAEESINADDDLNDLLTKLRKIVTSFKKNKNLMDELRSESTESNFRKPKQDIQTRWNSTFIMIDRYLDIHQDLSMVFLKNGKRDEDLDDYQIEYLKDVHLLMKPLYEMTVDISGEKYVTISRVIPLISNATIYLTKTVVQSDIGKGLKKRLLDNLNKRFNSVESVQIFAFSTLLDPRFKRVDFQSTATCSLMVSKLNLLLNEIPTTQIVPVDDVQLESIWSIHDKKVRSINDVSAGINSGFKHYLELPVLSRSDDPLSYWKNNKASWPQLHNLAMKYLTIQATSVPCERLFSKAGLTLTDKRNRIKPENVNTLLFLESLPVNYI